LVVLAHFKNSNPARLGFRRVGSLGGLGADKEDRFSEAPSAPTSAL